MHVRGTGAWEQSPESAITLHSNTFDWDTHRSGFCFLTFIWGYFHGGLSHGHPPCTSHMDEGKEVQRALKNPKSYKSII